MTSVSHSKKVLFIFVGWLVGFNDYNLFSILINLIREKLIKIKNWTYNKREPA